MISIELEASNNRGVELNHWNPRNAVAIRSDLNNFLGLSAENNYRHAIQCEQKTKEQFEEEHPQTVSLLKLLCWYKDRNVDMDSIDIPNNTIMSGKNVLRVTRLVSRAMKNYAQFPLAIKGNLQCYLGIFSHDPQGTTDAFLCELGEKIKSDMTSLLIFFL